jgi:hypothetical protein
VPCLLHFSGAGRAINRPVEARIRRPDGRLLHWSDPSSIPDAQRVFVAAEIFMPPFLRSRAGAAIRVDE